MRKLIAVAMLCPFFVMPLNAHAVLAKKIAVQGALIGGGVSGVQMLYSALKTYGLYEASMPSSNATSVKELEWSAALQAASAGCAGLDLGLGLTSAALMQWTSLTNMRLGLLTVGNVTATWLSLSVVLLNFVKITFLRQVKESVLPVAMLINESFLDALVASGVAVAFGAAAVGNFILAKTPQGHALWRALSPEPTDGLLETHGPFWR